MILQAYAIDLRALIGNAVACPFFQVQLKTPHERSFGNQNNISNICDFGSYEWVYYHDFGSFPENKEKLGRILGPCKNKCNDISQ